MATAALNRNRDHSTGLRLSRADMTFFLPDRGAANGVDGGLAGGTGVQAGRADMAFFLSDSGDSGWLGVEWRQKAAVAAAAPVPFPVIEAMPAPAGASPAATP